MREMGKLELKSKVGRVLGKSWPGFLARSSTPVPCGTMTVIGLSGRVKEVIDEIVIKY